MMSYFYNMCVFTCYTMNHFLANFYTRSGSVALQSGRKSQSSDPQRRNTEHNQAGVGMMSPSDFQSTAREEGEGMETTETESPSTARSPLPSLEQLLTSPDPKQGACEEADQLLRP